ncbi:MAG: elongation factor G [bacterium]
MKKVDSSDIRNIVLLGHAGSGKTTFAEAMMFNAGVTSRIGKVENGTSMFDYTTDSIDRKSSINLSLGWFEWKNKYLINIIDTPGYDDFYGDVITGARAADIAILIVNSCSERLELGAMKAKKLADSLNIPIVIFVNQLVKENANFDRTLNLLTSLFGKSVAPITAYESGKVVNTLETDSLYKSTAIEAIAEVDDALTEKYLGEQAFSPEEINNGIQMGIRNRKLVPLYAGDAYNNIGVKELLEAVAFLPSPLERQESKEPGLSALVFKTVVDPHLGDLRYIRVFSGSIEPGATVYNSNKKADEKLNQLYAVKGKDREEVPTGLVAGMIGAIVKLKNTQTGDTLAQKDKQIVFPAFEFPPYQTKTAIVPKTKKDEEKISNGLSKLRDEDPSFNSTFDPETKQTILTGMGEVHINVLLGRLKNRFGVDVLQEKPKIHYRETISRAVEQQGKYKRQTGGHGQYGDCWVKFEPLERGKGFEFVDGITEGRIPRRFIPSVEKGLREAIEKGILAGFPTTDLRATLYDGSYHDVDSSDIAFKIAANIAFKEGLTKAGITLIEPIMRVEILVPSEYMGDVMGDISSRRGKIEQTESVDTYQKLFALVPESELYQFSTVLRSLSQGAGTFTQTFSHYEEVPRETQSRVVEEYKKEPTEAE